MARARPRRDSDGDSDCDPTPDVLTNQGGAAPALPALPATVSVGSLTYFTNVKTKPAEVQKTTVATYCLLAATRVPHDKVGSIIKEYKDPKSPFSTKASRKVLAGSPAKLTYGTK